MFPVRLTLVLPFQLYQEDHHGNSNYYDNYEDEGALERSERYHRDPYYGPSLHHAPRGRYTARPSYPRGRGYQITMGQPTTHSGYGPSHYSWHSNSPVRPSPAHRYDVCPSPRFRLTPGANRHADRTR